MSRGQGLCCPAYTLSVNGAEHAHTHFKKRMLNSLHLFCSANTYTTKHRQTSGVSLKTLNKELEEQRDLTA